MSDSDWLTEVFREWSISQLPGTPTNDVIFRAGAIAALEHGDRICVPIRIDYTEDPSYCQGVGDSIKRLRAEAERIRRAE